MVLADDQPLVRAALQMVITDTADVQVVGEAGDGTEAVRLTGVALRAGATGFLVKDMALYDISAAVRIVAAGDALIAPSATRRLPRPTARSARRRQRRSRPGRSWT